MFDPGDIEWVPFPAHVVMSVDEIVTQARFIGVEGRVETLKHWDLVDQIFRLWVRNFPGEYRKFFKQQIALKKQQGNKYGSARDKGGAEMQYVMEVPRRFVNLLRGIFVDIDDQLLNKTFAMKLCKRLPIFQIPEKI